MTQNELNRAVASVTGETVSEISSRGFSPLSADPYDSGLEPIDWDWLDQSRSVAVRAVPQPVTCGPVMTEC